MMKYKLRIITGFLALLLFVLGTTAAHAVLTIPNSIMYQGVLTDMSGAPITSDQEIRFSIWSDSDLDAGDLLGDGSIDVTAGGYQGFQEVHTITPNSRGIFAVEIGTIDTLPNFESSKHLWLQVEIKPAGAPDTAFENMDPDKTSDLSDRKPIRSAPYASNSDTIDNREIGILEGDIAILSVDGQWTISQIPEGTNEASFTIDADDTAADVTLAFGSGITNFLQFDTVNDWFEFSNDVNFNNNQALNMAIHNGTDTAAVVGPVEGQIFWDSDDDIIYVYDAGLPAWIPIGGASTDADLLDSLDSTQFLRSDATDNYTSGILTFDLGTTLNTTAATVVMDGTNEDTFTLDEDGGGTNVTLEFGSVIGETLQWNDGNNRFELSDDLLVDGNITQNGNTLTLDGDNAGAGANVEIIANQGTDDDGILRYNAATDQWEISNDGGGTYGAVVGDNFTQTLTNKTIDGDNNTLQNIDWSSMKTREKTMVLTAEYAGYTIRPDGSNNLGTVSSDFVDLGGTDKFLFYRFDTRKNTKQDIDLILKVNLPSDFVSFTAAPLDIQYRTATGLLADNEIDITMTDSTGAAVALVGASDLVSTTFDTANITFGGVPTFTADGMLILTMKLQATRGNYADIGDVIIRYNGR